MTGCLEGREGLMPDSVRVAPCPPSSTHAPLHCCLWPPPTACVQMMNNPEMQAAMQQMLADPTMRQAMEQQVVHAVLPCLSSPCAGRLGLRPATKLRLHGVHSRSSKLAVPWGSQQGLTSPRR